MKKFIYLISLVLIPLLMSQCECTNCGSSNPGADSLSTTSDSLSATIDSIKVVDEKEFYIKIVDDVLCNFYGETNPNVIWDNGKIKARPKNYKLKYKIIKESEEDITLRVGMQSPYEYPGKICIKKDGEFTYLVDVYNQRPNYEAMGDDIRFVLKHKDIVYDVYGDRITLDEQIKNSEHGFLTILESVKQLKDDDKAIFAAILTSKVMHNLDYIEHDDYLEIFCENDEASYRFLIKESKDSSGYWGIINKMLKSAELQTETSDGSSSIYAFKASDKSTSIKRFMISLVRIVQDDTDNETSKQKKYGESSNTHHIVHDHIVARGGGIFGGGAAILATNEDTFTKKYLSEVSEIIVYTYDNTHLKLNGRSAYQGKVNKL